MSEEEADVRLPPPTAVNLHSKVGNEHTCMEVNNAPPWMPTPTWIPIPAFNLL